MARISDLLQRKNGTVWTISPTSTVFEGARMMREHNIGALVVEHEGQVVGIFTERDVLRRVVAEQRSPLQTLVGDAMTANVVCCSLDTTTDEARGAMRDRRIRHLPVADEDGQLMGLISMGDLNADLHSSQEQSIFLLQEYISGRV
ncbi:MAG: CBS domain-containing protein [Planctomycetales bacterium]